MGFRFEKLYADFVAHDGTVGVLYLASVDAWGIRSQHAGIELYWPDGRREVIRARPPEAPLRRPEAGAGMELALHAQGSRFITSYEPCHGAFLPEGPPPCDGLSWSVVLARAEVRVEWECQPARPRLSGTGYVDWVCIERSARQLGLSSVDWGRVHLPEETFIYTKVRFVDRTGWQRSARFRVGPTHEAWDGVAIAQGARLLRAEPPGEDKGERVIIAEERTLHDGEVIDRARFPGLLERMVARAIVGKATERRAVGRAYRGGPGCSGPSWAVYETVRFGGDS